MFEGKVYSQVSSEFVSPLFPAAGQEVEVSILFDSDIAVDESFCVTNKNGVQWRFSPDRREGGRIIYKVDGAYRPEVLRYYFVFRTGGRFYYYSKTGVTVYPPQNKNCFIITPAFEAPHWVAHAFCYQIFPDRFRNGDVSNDVHTGDYVYYSQARCLDFYNGDLAGIEQKLDYLESLGVSCIYLNPIVSSRTIHRFDAVDYFHVDGKLGGDEALASLISKCHERGIRVVVDISINHTSPENEWFRKAMADPDCPEAGFYYIGKDGSYAKWAGVDTMPQLNFNSSLLRDRLYRSADSAMQKSSYANFNASGDDFANYPINHGNETSMEVAYLFNRAGAPHLSQKWVRAIQEQYYGTTPYDAYPGDEDLGQMSSWFVMSAIGLFQMDGGCAEKPFYEVTTPRYSKITIHLDGKYGRGIDFVIEAPGASKENKYVHSIRLNGKRIDGFRIDQQEVLNIRWAFADPNPVAKESIVRSDRDALILGLEARGIE